MALYLRLRAESRNRAEIKSQQSASVSALIVWKACQVNSALIIWKACQVNSALIVWKAERCVVSGFSVAVRVCQY